MSTGAQWAEPTVAETWKGTGADGMNSLKQVAADRLTAHRQRRAAASAQATEQEVHARQHREAAHTSRRSVRRQKTSLVRETVAARYESRESYREYLAAEAERAIAQAQAEIAARNARAVSDAQMALLADFDQLDHLREPQPGLREQALAQHQAETRGELAHALADIVLGARELIAEPPQLSVFETPNASGDAHSASLASNGHSGPPIREISSAGLTVRLFEDIAATPPRSADIKPRRGHEPLNGLTFSLADEHVAEALNALEEEIDFRHAPVLAAATSLDMRAIPGNLIEFPRELVAPRRARPRLAEGPLCDEPGQPQLRIFEVDAEQSVLFETGAATSSFAPNLVPEWQSLQLSGFGAEAGARSSASDAQTHLALPLHTAPLERRLMAAAVDLCIVAAAWLAALTCVTAVAGATLHALSLPLATLAGAGAFSLFAVLYQLLFFTLAESTPGMRYARIALCTFGDGNPTRLAMRRRVFSSILAACPLGLGLAWALLDNDHLGWHDRMSRMYQRAY